jgi:pectate lyase
MFEPRLFRRVALTVMAVGLQACASAQPASARVLAVGPGAEYKQPSDAIRAAADGDTVRIAPGEYFDCAIVSANKLTIEGTGPNATAVLTDKACAGKALLVAAGSDITIRNLTLTRARVPDMNGAGIRAEGTNLTVDGVHFINNQNGILAGEIAGSTIVVRNSEFDRNGVCSPGCAHGIYVGKIALLRVENSKFTDTRQGHHIKSRALRTEVIGCNISDGPDGTASYMIEVPNGGNVVVRDTTLEKGPKSENHTGAIVIGMEGVSQPTREITIENNTFRNAGSYPTFMVVNTTAEDAKLRGNRISGNAKPLRGDGDVR